MIDVALISPAISQKLVETASLNIAIRICIIKNKSNDKQAMTVSEVLNDEYPKRIIEDDEALKFLKAVRCTLAFWQQKIERTNVYEKTAWKSSLLLPLLLRLNGYS